MAKIGPQISLLIFDNLVQFWIMSVPKQPPLKLKSENTRFNLGADCFCNEFEKPYMYPQRALSPEGCLEMYTNINKYEAARADLDLGRVGRRLEFCR